MDLSQYRQQIDSIDKELVRLFGQRMDVAGDIARYKQQHNLPVYDPKRERDKLEEVGAMADPAQRDATERLYGMLFELSRTAQRQPSPEDSKLLNSIEQALKDTPPLFPEKALVACQGVEGANSQSAAQKLFKQPNIMHFSSFEGVFAAIEQGLCQYGVLPLENSTAGSVNRIYDLMMRHNFYVVRATRLKIDHCLMANKGVELKDIKEIFSHEQALQQSEGFLKSLPGVKVTAVENTALAAQMVLESGRRDAAALSSRSCAEIYGLNILKHSVQDSGSNFTRFICISKKMEIYPGADKTSMMMVLPHRPGSLYMALGRFWSLGINLNKLESRPLAGSDFEFMFYFDLDTPVYSEAFTRLFHDISSMCSQFRYLGSYTEVV